MTCIEDGCIVGKSRQSQGEAADGDQGVEIAQVWAHLVFPVVIPDHKEKVQGKGQIVQNRRESELYKEPRCRARGLIAMCRFGHSDSNSRLH